MLFQQSNPFVVVLGIVNIVVVVVVPRVFVGAAVLRLRHIRSAVVVVAALGGITGRW